MNSVSFGALVSTMSRWTMASRHGHVTALSLSAGFDAP
jgi:hypothetical protein